jgi:hypothetical protein
LPIPFSAGFCFNQLQTLHSTFDAAQGTDYQGTVSSRTKRGKQAAVFCIEYDDGDEEDVQFSGAQL